MECLICGCTESDELYNGSIRKGFGYTERNYKVYRCKNCKTIWNDALYETDTEYYASGEYERDVINTEDINISNTLWDEAILEKFEITGSDIFRNKIVADIGCGSGEFLDALYGLAEQTIAIEPTRAFHDQLAKKHQVYSTSSECLSGLSEKVDLVVSFDALEHIKEPIDVLIDAYQMLKPGGDLILATPNESPVLMEYIGDSFKKFWFRTQHPWIFSAEGLTIMLEKCGFKKDNIIIKTKQRYGLGNLLAWAKYGQPKGDIHYDFISSVLDKIYISELEKSGKGDVWIVKAKK